MFPKSTSDFRAAAVLAIASALVLGFAAPAAAAPGAVYTMTNSADGNAVVMYDRMPDGMLGQARFFPTGGLGTGAGLGSQGALALSESGHWLIVVNAGSNDVTVFSAAGMGLTLTDRQPSGGMMPISVALAHGIVFVLNGGGSANITGFRLTARGRLVPIPGSTRVLPGQAPAQVSFAAGRALVVTEKASNTITVYTIDDQSLAGPFIHASSGPTPFGFGVARSDVLVVSEAAGGAVGASTVSSYEVDDTGGLRLITASLATGETAACWVAVTRSGKYAYIANTGSSTISSAAVGRDGSLTLLEAVAGRTPAGTPAIDLALSLGSKYLYGLAGNTISAFQVSADGSLTPVQVVSGIPPSAAGLVAR